MWAKFARKFATALGSPLIQSQIRDMERAMDKAKAEGDREELGRLNAHQNCP